MDPSTPVVAHSVTPYLPKSGSWIHAQIAALERYRPIVLTKRVKNLESFPFEPVHAWRRLSFLRRGWEAYRRRDLGYFPFHREVCRRAGAELLHSHFGHRGYQDVFLHQALGIPHVTSFYGFEIWQLSRDPAWLERYAHYFAASELFLVEGNAMRDKVVSIGCPPAKVRVHHLGVDLERIPFRPRALGSGPVRFLIAGRMAEKKGHDLAVRAFARVHRRNPRTHLGMILGAVQGREKESLAPVLDAVREERIDSAVTLHGFMPYAEYLRTLEQYHVFLVPSRHAKNGDAEGGFPVTILEMSASGVPIVASDHCDIPEAVLHERSGLIFPENDVDAMAEAMLRIADETQRWEDYGRAGRAHVQAEYDVPAQARRLERIYDELLGTVTPSSIERAGTPATRAPAGTSARTSAPAATSAPAPIVTP